MPLFSKGKSKEKSGASAQPGGCGYPVQNNNPAASHPLDPPPPYTPYQQPPTVVVVQGGFAAGARFNVGATPHIPPPPPGCAANPAQMAVMSGQSVVVTQQKETILEGTGSGGYTW